MPEKKIRVREFLEDVRAQVNRTALMKKYGLDANGLRRVFRELSVAGLVELVGREYVVPAVRRLSARAIASDIRTGLTGSQLMAKYVLTSAQLSKAIDGLIHSKALGPGEIKENFLSSAVQVSPENLREVERCYLDFELPIVDTGPPEIDGMVRNLTEKGVGIVGIPSRVGESKTFLVLHDEFVLIEPFMFEAQCRWATRNDPGGEFVSGFEITDISEKDLGELQKLIHLVTFYA